MWLGSGLVAGLGSYAILRAQLPSDALLTPETPQFYFLILVGTAAWLGVGVASTIAGLAVASQQESGPSAKANGLQGKEGQATPALQPVREPTPAPRRRSRPLRRDEDSY